MSRTFFVISCDGKLNGKCARRTNLPIKNQWARQLVGAILSVWLERRGYNEAFGAHQRIVGQGLTARESPDICQADYIQWDEQSADVGGTDLSLT